MTLPGDWYDGMHTAEDVAAARLVLMRWIERTGNADEGGQMAERITVRAVELGLEEP
jgi:hypothetical protein